MNLEASIKQIEALICSELGILAEFVAEPGQSYALLVLIKLSFQG